MNLKNLIVWLQLHYIDALVAFDYVTTAREQRHPTQGWLPERIRQYDSSDTGHSDNVNIAAEHQEPAEVLSVTLQFMGSTSVASVASSGVLLAASGAVCDSSLFSLEIAVSTKLLTSDGAR